MNIKQRIDDLSQRRDSLSDEVQRIQIKLENAQENEARIRKECQDRKLDPDNLDQAIEKLEARFESSVQELESKINTAEEALKPFMGGA
jgi:chromosome segregation ATPase